MSLMSFVRRPARWMAVCMAVWAMVGVAGAQPPEQPPAPVATARVVEGAISQPLRLTGDVQAAEQTPLSSELTGIVEEILVEAGDYVTTGTELLRLRQRPLELELARSAAEAREDAELLRELRAGSRAEDVAIARANWEEARVAAEIAQSELHRNERLLADGTISQSQFDAAKTRWAQADAAEKVMKATLDRALAGPRDEAVAAQEAKAQGTAAAANLAEDRLERSVIRAPYAGYITRRYVSPGAWVSAGSPLLEIAYLDIVRLAVNVPESHFPRVRVGDEFQITFDAFPKERFMATVQLRIPTADTRSRAFPVRMTIPNPDHRLAPGMLARVYMDLREEGDQSLMVHKDALVAMMPSPIVYKIEMRDGEAFAQPVPVETGRFFGEAVEVFGELRPGDQVVVRGNERLTPGQKVVLNTFTTDLSTANLVDPSMFFDESRRVQ